MCIQRDLVGIFHVILALASGQLSKTVFLSTPIPQTFTVTRDLDPSTLFNTVYRSCSDCVKQFLTLLRSPMSL